jgi:hypothetical protein
MDTETNTVGRVTSVVPVATAELDGRGPARSDRPQSARITFFDALSILNRHLTF